MGQVLYKSDVQSNVVVNINLGTMPKGVYFMFVTNNNKTVSEKIIIEQIEDYILTKKEA